MRLRPLLEATSKTISFGGKSFFFFLFLQGVFDVSPLLSLASHHLLSFSPTPVAQHTRSVSFWVRFLYEKYNKKKKTLKYAYAKRNLCVQRLFRLMMEPKSSNNTNEMDAPCKRNKICVPAALFFSEEIPFEKLPRTLNADDVNLD